MEWGRGIVDELLLSCPVCSLERILHFVIANSFIRSISDDKIELNRYDKIENCLNVSLSANFWMLAWALKNDCRFSGLNTGIHLIFQLCLVAGWFSTVGTRLYENTCFCFRIFCYNMYSACKYDKDAGTVHAWTRCWGIIPQHLELR